VHSTLNDSKFVYDSDWFKVTFLSYLDSFKFRFAGIVSIEIYRKHKRAPIVHAILLQDCRARSVNGHFSILQIKILCKILAKKSFCAKACKVKEASKFCMFSTKFFIDKKAFYLN